MTGPAHATYAPSSAHRWMECTASASAIAALPEQEEGEEAAEGTAAHEEIERCISPMGVPLPVNREHSAAYGIALLLDYVSQLPAGQMWVEQRVTLTPQIWGRCDVAHWHEESATLTIVDYKNGYVNVEAEENEQLRIYGAGSIYTHKLPAKWVRYVVVQPNSFMPVPRVKQWVESAESLHEFATRAAAVPDGPLTFKAGEHCRYCPLFGRCEATRDLLVHLSTMMQHTPEEVRAEQVAIVKALEKPIADWFKQLDKVKTKDALAGKVMPGMKLVTATKHRDWRDPVAARREVVAALGDAALDLCTPAQAEKLGMDKAVVDRMAVKPEGGPALAFESDKRPTFARKSAAEMFAGVSSSVDNSA